MAYASHTLIKALRGTALRLASVDTEYRWTHMGACNCGHLAQHVTRHSASDLRRMSQYKAGDWADQALEYCKTSTLPIDHVIGALLEIGLEPRDIGHLERLSDKRILRRLPAQSRYLDFRRRGDVVVYLRTWAELLQDEMNEVHQDLAEVA